jgi:RNA polymerase sigma-70 factor (ECF subfamily)
MLPARPVDPARMDVARVGLGVSPAGVGLVGVAADVGVVPSWSTQSTHSTQLAVKMLVGIGRRPIQSAGGGGRVVWGRDEATDDALVVAVGDRDQEALGEIYRRYGGAVWSVAKRVCRNPDLAEEVCQTVFTELWSRPERYDPSRGSLRPWLVAQAHSRAVDVVRSEEARRRRQERDAQLNPPPQPAEVEVAVHAAAMASDVRRAVDQLPADERNAILLAYFGGHTYTETAALLGAPEGTIKSRIRRGLQTLRRSLEAEGVTR